MLKKIYLLENPGSEPVAYRLKCIALRDMFAIIKEGYAENYPAVKYEVLLRKLNQCINDPVPGYDPTITELELK